MERNRNEFEKYGGRKRHKIISIKRDAIWKRRSMKHLIIQKYDFLKDMSQTVLFYTILFYSTLFCSALFCSVLFSSTLFYTSLFYSILLSSIEINLPSFCILRIRRKQDFVSLSQSSLISTETETQEWQYEINMWNLVALDDIINIWPQEIR